jgi:hypothetical protein
MYSTGGKRKDNPIEDELVFRVGTDGQGRIQLGTGLGRGQDKEGREVQNNLTVNSFVFFPIPFPQAVVEGRRVNSPIYRVCPQLAVDA